MASAAPGVASSSPSGKSEHGILNSPTRARLAACPCCFTGPRTGRLSPDSLPYARPLKGEPGCPQPGSHMDVRATTSEREQRPMNLLAYHITWGTYGTRLHGDPRKTVD